MSSSVKRIIILVSFLASVIVLGYLLYFFFLKPQPPVQPPTNTNTNVSGGLPGAGINTNIPISGSGGLLPPGTAVGLIPETPSQITTPIAQGGPTEISALTDARVLNPTITSNGDILYYDQNAGLFQRVNENGTINQYADEVFFQVQKVNWSPTQDQAILEYPDGANILYNFQNKKQVTLPAQWKDFDFAPKGDQIIFKSIGSTPENRWLAISKPDGAGAKKLEHLGDKDSTVYPLWAPHNQVVAMYSEDRNFDQQDLYFVGQFDENFKSTIIDGRDFRGQWSETGDKLLYSVYSGNSGWRPSLWVVSGQGNALGQSRRDLKLNTWADKCAFSGNSVVYCAVPQGLPEGSGIFANELDNLPTDIYKIDLQTGFRTKIATPEGDHNIGQIMTTKDNRNLYFTSKTDGKLYKIQIK